MPHVFLLTMLLLPGTSHSGDLISFPRFSASPGKAHSREKISAGISYLPGVADPSRLTVVRAALAGLVPQAFVTSLAYALSAVPAADLPDTLDTYVAALTVARAPYVDHGMNLDIEAADEYAKNLVLRKSPAEARFEIANYRYVLETFIGADEILSRKPGASAKPPDEHAEHARSVAEAIRGRLLQPAWFVSWSERRQAALAGLARVHQTTSLPVAVADFARHLARRRSEDIAYALETYAAAFDFGRQMDGGLGLDPESAHERAAQKVVRLVGLASVRHEIEIFRTALARLRNSGATNARAEARAVTESERFGNGAGIDEYLKLRTLAFDFLTRSASAGGLGLTVPAANERVVEVIRQLGSAPTAGAGPTGGCAEDF